MERTTAETLNRASHYSPLAFLRGQGNLLAASVLEGLGEDQATGKLSCVGEAPRLWVRHLEWDTRHFGVPTYRLDFADWRTTEESIPATLAAGVVALREELQERHGRHYLFAEVPSEDTTVLQGLGLAAWRLVETRLTYFREDLDRFAWPRRYQVRPATESDIPGLRETAMQARNPFDRFHADAFFPATVADRFLATFVENSVRGYADIVLVPADTDSPPAAFLTASLMRAQSDLLGVGVGRMVLSAVGEAKRGWYPRLVTEMNYWMKGKGVKIAYMTTQSTNRDVVRVWERLGFGYGRASHIFAAHA